MFAHTGNTWPKPNNRQNLLTITWTKWFNQALKNLSTKISTHKLLHWFFMTLLPLSKFSCIRNFNWQKLYASTTVQVWHTLLIYNQTKKKNKLKREWRGQTGGGGRMPIAPNPALSFPPMLIKSKTGKSVSLEGTGLNFPSHSTNRGALGSPKTKSSFNPLSTYNNQQRFIWTLTKLVT